MISWQLDLGARPEPGGIRFRVWAPLAQSVSVILSRDGHEQAVPLERDGEHFSGVISGAVAGDRYWYLIDGHLRRPDPASRCQPDGVHGPSQVVDPEAFCWTDGQWRGIPLKDLITYELHVGTFTHEGTFDGAIGRLDYLAELGITAVELMPVAQFPGDRNWGYDGVFPYAPHPAYGGAAGLKRFVDACHRRGMAVILDVVYNHLGPEGNYLHGFAPYFTGHYRTPWGDAVNYDGSYSDGVRHYVIANALHWVAEYHMDGLRLDAVHGIYDFSARHILAELADAVHSLAGCLGRQVHVIAESDLNDARIVIDPEHGGHGLDAQWSDDFHHALHTLLTGERRGYYEDFGAFSQMLTALRDGFVYAGTYSRHRRRRHGSDSSHLPPQRFVVCIQNHDQVGNRALGDRLSSSLSPEQLKLAAAMVILSPYLPLLFMGEEYGETAPFPYFTSHGDPDLADAVRKGRREEFAPFGWDAEVPDPQAEETFRSARIDPETRHRGVHRHLFAFTRELIRLRKILPPFSVPTRQGTSVAGFGMEQVLMVNRHGHGDEVICIFNLSGFEQPVPVIGIQGRHRKVLDSTEGYWGGGGGATPDLLDAGALLLVPPFAVLIYQKEPLP
ncbi:malto-oligosyltrehalose trehalohydrolase [Geobacter grbiciae]|uniref:malto-oligosyltrehalose trehalohydrolase n=1 Tax=Geobacter grbiciae TaxID=155042 RepID=UPI001C00F493|nr:malto-oligosyltrehalose trehalohydrolase [Geobacter grbiciae]MBT1073989.1 malto-oligosyltrehalose trehalohydrolase [Geobacter grbiciae]